LKEIPDNIKAALEIHPVHWIDEVLATALERIPQPLSDAASPALSAPKAAAAQAASPYERIKTPSRCWLTVSRPAGIKGGSSARPVAGHDQFHQPPVCERGIP